MRKVFIAAGVVSMVSLAMAQKFEVGVDGGYGFGYGGALVGDYTVRDTSGYNTVDLKNEQVYASGGTGKKIRGEVAYFLTENVGIMVASGYSMKSSYTTGVTDPYGSILTKVTTSYLPVNIGLKFRAKMGIGGIKVVPYVYVAPGIYFPKKTKDTTYNSGSMSYTGVVTYTYSGGFGVSAGIGAAIMLPLLSNRVGIKVEFSPTYAFASPTKYRVQGSSTGLLPTDTTYTYKNNSLHDINGNLPAGVAIDQPHDTYCSMAVRVGLCIKIF
jgi:hypothetical protein